MCPFVRNILIYELKLVTDILPLRKKVDKGCEKMLDLHLPQDILHPLYLAIVNKPGMGWREGFLKVSNKVLFLHRNK